MRNSIVFSILTALLLTGCQMTSGKLTSQIPECFNLKKKSEYLGAKPNWDNFSDVKQINRCRQGGQFIFGFKLDDGKAMSQFTQSDNTMLPEVTERVFREMMATTIEFNAIATSIKVSSVTERNAPTLYAIKNNGARPQVIALFNNGYQSADIGGWSEFHQILMSPPSGITNSKFEEWFRNKLNDFERNGGIYSNAF